MRLGPYSEDLKQEIIHLKLEEKRTIQSLSKEYGVSVSTISRWVTIHRNTATKKTEEIKR